MIEPTNPDPDNPQSAIRNPQLDYIHPDLRSLAVPIDDLVRDPANARRHSKKNIDAIKASLQAFGQRRPAVVQTSQSEIGAPAPVGHPKSAIIRAGNGMHIAAKQLGWTHLAVIPWETSDVQAVAYAIADNRTAELATWNDPVLGDLLVDLEVDHAGINQMLDDLRTDLTARGLAQTELEPEPIQYQVLVKCPNEQTQRDLLERFQAAGHTCRCTFA